MKRLVCAVLAFVMVSVAAMGQGNITQAQKAEFEKFLEFQKMKGAVEATPAEQVSKYAGIGKEIGVALKEAVQAMDQGLTVTEDHIYKFSSTGLGKVTIGVIIWKIAGKDALGLVVGFLLLLFMIGWIRFWWKTLFVGRLVLDKQVGKEKTYVRLDPIKNLSSEAYAFWSAVFVIGSCVFFGGSMLCFFK